MAQATAVERADVVVVGGGPAGSVTATLLARQGIDVLLLDRAAFPRSKPCGESLNPGAVRELEELGLLAAVSTLPNRRIARWRVRPLRGEAFEGRFPEGIFGLAIDRAALDSALLDCARRSGVRVRTAVRVTDLIRHEGRIVGVEVAGGGAIHARLVVGADGLRSVVVRRLGLIRRPPRLRKVALTAHVEVPDLPQDAGHLTITPWGCIGVAPIARDSANVVLVLDGEARGQLDGDPAACFDRLMAQAVSLRDAVRIGEVLVTGPFDCPTRAVTTDGALLVGDAAGYFDPLTGQGIYRAVHGAKLAAQVAGPLVLSGPVTRQSLSSYERGHKTAFLTGTAVQRLIEVGVAYPTVFSAAAAVLRASPTAANAVLRLIGDVRPGLASRHRIVPLTSRESRGVAAPFMRHRKDPPPVST